MMPSALRERLLSIDKLFLFIVVLPTVAAALYFGLFASDVYISESRFVVRSPEKPAATGLGVILKTAGFANAGDEIYAAKDYVVSRDALRSIDRGSAFAKAYGNGSVSIFDRFNPIGIGGTFEDLYKYYLGKVGIDHDTTSTITKLTVRAYTAKDAQRFNEQLLEMAEATVNRLNERGRHDLIHFAEVEVSDAEGKAQLAGKALAAFRNREGVVDPERQALVQMQMISKLQDELISAKTQRAQLQRFAPRNPQMQSLDTQIATLQNEIGDQTRMVAGNNKSLAGNAAEYQRLQLASQFADKQLASALTSLEEAKNEARRKQAYVERIVQPNLPDSPLEPRRLRGIFATLIVGLVIWGILVMLLAGVREHRS